MRPKRIAEGEANNYVHRITKVGLKQRTALTIDDSEELSEIARHLASIESIPITSTMVSENRLQDILHNIFHRNIPSSLTTIFTILPSILCMTFSFPLMFMCGFLYITTESTENKIVTKNISPQQFF